MVTIKDIKDYYQDRYRIVVMNKSKDILTNDKLKNFTKSIFLIINNPSSELYYLKYYLYDKDLNNEMFKLLDEKKYNKNYEVKDLLKSIANNLSFSNLQGSIEKYKNSPYIDDIKLKGDTLEIVSRSLGHYEIIMADKYFMNDYSIHDYIKNEKLDNKCHNHVEFLVSQNSNFYSITSICTNRFIDTNYYHSYCYDNKTNRVIDLCYNLVMDKDKYDKLFNSKEIFRIKGKKLDEAYHLALLSDISLGKWYKPITSTLFQQYIWENGFKSPDKKIYTERPKLLMKTR